jgi:predicted MFS family arabinose efflux permease
MTAVYAILQVEKWGWDSAGVLTLAGVAVVLVVAFLVRQAKIANPLMPLRLFRSRTLSGANIIQALLVAGMFGMFFLAALYVQQILGYSALQVGLTFLPTTIVMGAMSLRFSGPLTMRYGVRPTLVVSFLLVAAGLLLFARTPVHGHYVTDLLAPSMLLGLGAGLGFPGLMALAMSGVAMEDSGLASGLVNTAAQVGGAVGLAVLATAAAGRTSSELAAGVDPASALNSGYHLAYLIGAALVAVAAVIVLAVARKPAASDEAPVDDPEYAEAA